eukprot:TRINITY_DN7832_c0_g1_i1.p1 TRINITY_DN7832_c0_g1~~TRINITY_DN7832_c0_g1_i1.p1  ORF type:complete len:308 (-),score=53.52 TRINITY_DN7832_c0_g1_i1:84-1007(-)
MLFLSKTPSPSPSNYGREHPITPRGDVSSIKKKMDSTRRKDRRRRLSFGSDTGQPKKRKRKKKKKKKKDVKKKKGSKIHTKVGHVKITDTIIADKERQITEYSEMLQNFKGASAISPDFGRAKKKMPPKYKSELHNRRKSSCKLRPPGSSREQCKLDENRSAKPKDKSHAPYSKDKRKSSSKLCSADIQEHSKSLIEEPSQPAAVTHRQSNSAIHYAQRKSNSSIHPGKTREKRNSKSNSHVHYKRKSNKIGSTPSSKSNGNVAEAKEKRRCGDLQELKIAVADIDIDSALADILSSPSTERRVLWL